jgi:hypothetical protein
MALKRPGRPPLDPDDPAVDVHLRLPSKQYDDVYQRAQQAKTTVPDLIRRMLKGSAEDFRDAK